MLVTLEAVVALAVDALMLVEDPVRHLIERMMWKKLPYDVVT